MASPVIFLIFFLPCDRYCVMVFVTRLLLYLPATHLSALLFRIPDACSLYRLKNPVRYAQEKNHPRPAH